MIRDREMNMRWEVKGAGEWPGAEESLAHEEWRVLGLECSDKGVVGKSLGQMVQPTHVLGGHSKNSGRST